MKIITIRTFGEFTLEADGIVLSDSGTRVKKAWSLLAYLVCSRNRTVSQSKLIDLLWSEDSGSTNPENALRITLHRLRTMLDQLWPDAGRELILNKAEGYCWNPEAPVRLDHEEFEGLRTGVYATDEEKLTRYLEALALFKGEFLPKHRNELWAIPIASHFHNHYLELVKETGELLLRYQRSDEAVDVVCAATLQDPYNEELAQLLMRALGSKGDYKGAEAVYDALRIRLQEDFGVQPSEETWQVYRVMAHAPEQRMLQMDEILTGLQEDSAPNGAMVCDYDYFKVLCFSESRKKKREGHEVHIALISISDEGYSKRSISTAMDQLEEVLKANLRLGDTISRCSTTQYIIMLPKADYENPCMVCRRLIAAFSREHPRSHANLQFIVQPLNAALQMPV